MRFGSVPAVEPHVVDIDAAATYDLRRRVLRATTPSDEVEFDGDDAPDTIHLGVVDAGRIVAISTWMTRSCVDHVDRPARQLRGMATDPAEQGRGLGTLLLRAGVARATATGAELVWANARVGAYAFYLRHGFEFAGPEFVEADTGIVHRRIVQRLGSARPVGRPTGG